MGGRFQSLTRADKSFASRCLGGHGLVNGSGVRGGHRADHNRRLRYGGCEIVGDSNLFGQLESRKIGFVFARKRDFGGAIPIVDPQRNFMRVPASRENERERRAPASAAENGDPAHSDPLLLRNEKRDSRPSTRRWIFASCL